MPHHPPLAAAAAEFELHNLDRAAEHIRADLACTVGPEVEVEMSAVIGLLKASTLRRSR